MQHKQHGTIALVVKLLHVTSWFVVVFGLFSSLLFETLFAGCWWEVSEVCIHVCLCVLWYGPVLPSDCIIATHCLVVTEK